MSEEGDMTAGLDVDLRTLGPLIVSENIEELRLLFEKLERLQITQFAAESATPQGYTPLQLAAISGSEQICSFLLPFLSGPLALNAADSSGHTALIFAAIWGNDEVVRLLLDAGADCDVVSRDVVVYVSRIPMMTSGGTALHHACTNMRISTIKLLVERGANLSLVNADGLTAWQLVETTPRADEFRGILCPADTPLLDIEARKTLAAERLRDQRNRIQRERPPRQTCSEVTPPLYTPAMRLHQELFEPDVFRFLVPSIVTALRENTAEALRPLVTEIAPHVYIFDLFNADFCRLILEETAHFEKSGLEVSRPNTMNNHGVILNNLGMHPLFDSLMRSVIEPLSHLLFPETIYDRSPLRSHHTFTVEYELGADVDLATHVDDSLITLNVCLTNDFTGGTLYFHGVRAEDEDEDWKTPHEPNCRFCRVTYLHRLGHAVLHMGRHIHGVNRIESGRRANLILWCRDRAT
eukprot:gnl/Spiro4/6824_TR3534_c0_g1_i1.p1 gnl/Spiro4/6824_TR3534_c0_g1~~gnl/Spiro4/6824_TR3534_c0_g1_i1.p1  ORF type:complete len:481 (+),score=72.61 gnl/Spiro4/6824_TR3534_c0_g1_i1:45-1445(+)